MSNTLVEKFNAECQSYLTTELKTHLLLSLSSVNKSEYYLTEYQRCMNEQISFIDYINEQISSLNTLKLCETNLDRFIQRLKTIHQYELKQNEIFEKILHELTKLNEPNKDEHIRLIQQIDELIAYKSKLINNNKLSIKLSDTFKNIL